jgi:mannosyl-oligosaccharide alpha-1,2-mannosidase
VISFNGWGLTIYDSLSTMAVMNLTSHLSRATAYISEQLARNATHPFVVNPDAENKHVPFFETTIRYLGSLLSTYALTGEPDLLAAADKLGTALLPAFNTPSGLPRWGIDTVTYVKVVAACTFILILSQWKTRRQPCT